MIRARQLDPTPPQSPHHVFLGTWALALGPGVSGLDGTAAPGNRSDQSQCAQEVLLLGRKDMEENRSKIEWFRASGDQGEFTLIASCAVRKGGTDMEPRPDLGGQVPFLLSVMAVEPPPLPCTTRLLSTLEPLSGISSAIPITDPSNGQQ